MRDNHCIWCKEILRGRATGRNEYIRHNGGLIHTKCMEPYKEDLLTKYYPNSRTLRIGGHRDRDPVKKAIYQKGWYQRNKERLAIIRKQKRFEKMGCVYIA